MRERQSGREGWRCATMKDGVLSVVRDGLISTHKLCAMTLAMMYLVRIDLIHKKNSIHSASNFYR